jgi:hypothetical protein
MERDAQRASIKRPIYDPFAYLLLPYGANTIAMWASYQASVMVPRGRAMTPKLCILFKRETYMPSRASMRLSDSQMWVPS